jgi:hypothetical protein
MSTMSTTQWIIIAGLISYAVYKQTKVAPVTGRGRFRLALIYAIIGLALGVTVPHSAAGLGLIAASLVFSLVVGLARGACTRVWRDRSGRVLSRGTVVTIGLFLALIASKFLLGTVAYFLKIHDSSMGEILLMIGISVAIQAEIVWRRAQALGAGPRSGVCAHETGVVVEAV